MRRRVDSTDWLLGALLALIALAVIAPAAYAGDRITQSNDNNAQTTGDVTVGDNISENTSSIGGSRAYGLSFSLGDVDIRDCRETTQTQIVVFARQNVRLNPWCAAEVYDSRGMHEMAAIMRCSIREISKHFSTQEDCVKANTVVLHMEPVEVPRSVESDLEPILSRLSELESRNNELQEEYDALTASQARSRANAQRAAQVEREEAQRLLEALRDDEQD